MSELRVIHPQAKIAEGVQIGPFTTIAADVEIGRNSWIASGVSIMDGVRVGENCKIFPGAIVGGVPQDLKFHGEQSILTIGNQVTIREYATLNRGTEANFSTTIKDNCLLMAYVHVAHDCILEENCILANNVNLAGHIRLGKYAILGGLTAVHQFVQIGEHVMVGGGSLVRKDVPPYVKAAREPLSYAGVNSVGLRRRGFSNEIINEIHNIYRILFVKGMNISQAMAVIENEFSPSMHRDNILEFIRSSTRGLMKGFRQISGNGN